MIDEPLGLPRGSVRAVIFILVTIGLLLAPLYTGLDVKEWFSILSYAWIIIIGFYFGTRSHEGKNQT